MTTSNLEQLATATEPGFSFHFLILVGLNAKFFEWMGTYAIFVPWALVATFLLGRLGARGQVPLATKG